MFWYPQGGSYPRWIEPDTSAIATLRALNEIEVRRIYEEAHLHNGHAAEQPRSGVAHSYEWRRTNDDISAKARSLEQFERSIDSLFAAWLGLEQFAIDSLFAAWLGLEPFDSTVSYPRDFSVLAFSARLSEAKTVFSLPLPDSARRLYLPKIPLRRLIHNLAGGDSLHQSAGGEAPLRCPQTSPLSQVLQTFLCWPLSNHCISLRGRHDARTDRPITQSSRSHPGRADGPARRDPLRRDT